MNDYEEKQRSIDKIYESWKNTEFLDGIEEKYHKKVSVILDNQKLFDGLDNLNPLDPINWINGQIIQKVFQNFIPFDLVSIQPMIKPVDITYSKKYESNDIVIIARMRKISNDLDSNIICDVITREIINDISNNVGTISDINKNINDLNYEDIYVDICRMSSIIYKKSRGKSYWIIAGPEIIEKFPYYSFNTNEVNLENIKNITYIGFFRNVWKLFLDPSLKLNEILLGSYAEDEFYDSYFYCPYVMVVPVEKQIFSRYAKKLGNNKFFAKIKYNGGQI